MIKKRLSLALWAIFASHLGFAQLNNKALENKLLINPEHAGELHIGLNSLAYGKNNEYSSNLYTGYTFLGYHLNPKLIYYPSEHVRIEGGVQLRKDFGTTKYELVQPTFTIKYEKNGIGLVFGTLEGNLNHGYIEPLYDFERVITNRLENGIQFLVNKPGVKLDAWIDWQRYIEAGDPFQEEIVGGATAEFKLYQTPVSLDFPENKPKSTFYVGLPVQFTAQHRGGQIDATDLPVQTKVNGAVGLILRKEYHQKKVLKALHFQPYVVGFTDNSGVVRQAYEDGYGLYLNAGADTKILNVMASYWRGDSYVAELGGKLYPSISSAYGHEGEVQEKHELLILRFMKDVKLAEGLTLVARFEPVFDFDNGGELQFSNGLYLNFNSEFFLAKLRRR